MPRAVVTGAGGFIGGHLVKRLIDDGYTIVAIDRKPRSEWWQVFMQGGVETVDGQELSPYNYDFSQAVYAYLTQGEPIDEFYHLAADMGGIGFIEANRVLCMKSMLTTFIVLDMANAVGVAQGFQPKVLYTSSACAYNVDIQTGQGDDVTWLKESDAYPANPEDGYGWEKLTGERLMRHYMEERGMPTYVARLHNVYGPHGTWDGGREKAPAALCRKMSLALMESANVENAPVPEIEVWGDGRQVRTFMYVDDCVEGLRRLISSDHHEPINLGSDETITIDELLHQISEITQLNYTIKHVPGAQGVPGRASDNTKILEVLNWAPSWSLHDGLPPTLAWIMDEMVAGNAGDHA